MANMGYCRFENTYRDLIDCYYNINSSLSDNEHEYRQRLIGMCQNIIEEYDQTCQDEDENN